MFPNRSTLVLNASYEPVNVVSARRAITLVMKGAAIVEEESGITVRSSLATFKVPSVIRLLVYRRVPHQSRAVSRKNIMLRDRHTCQYCHRVFIPKCLTMDHVLPQSRGGASTWENLVAACRPCNNRKADRTPTEAGMPLSRKPVRVTIHAKHRSLASDPAWDKYLFA